MAKIKKWLKPKSLELIRELAGNKENTIAKIAAKMGISPSTFYNWLNDYQEIRESFEDGRKRVDEEVEGSFFKMCTGYHESVTEMQKIRRCKFNENGKKIEEFEEFIPVEKDVYVQPSVAAQKLYLVNRMPEKYRPENAVVLPDENDNDGGVVMLPEIIEGEEK